MKKILLYDHTSLFILAQDPSNNDEAPNDNYYLLQVPQSPSSNLSALKVSKDTAISTADDVSDVYNILQIESNDNNSSKTLIITSVNTTANAIRWTVKEQLNDS